MHFEVGTQPGQRRPLDPDGMRVHEPGTLQARAKPLRPFAAASKQRFQLCQNGGIVGRHEQERRRLYIGEVAPHAGGEKHGLQRGRSLSQERAKLEPRRPPWFVRLVAVAQVQRHH